MKNDQSQTQPQVIEGSLDTPRIISESASVASPPATAAPPPVTVTSVGIHDAATPSVVVAEPSDLPASGKKQISSADKVKFIGLAVFFLLVAIISIFVAVVIVNMGTENLVAELEKAILEAGPFGILICLGIQLVQIIIAFIPGEAAQAAIGYVYGTIGGGFITLAGALLGSICVFYLVRKLGAPFVQGMIGDKDSGRFKFLHESKNLNALIFILYLIPGLPKDVFTYVFPLTDIRPSTFFVLSTIARAPAIFATTFVVTAFREGDFLAMAIVAIIFGGLGIIGIFFNQKVIGLVNSLMKKISPHEHHEDDKA